MKKTKKKKKTTMKKAKNREEKKREEEEASAGSSAFPRGNAGADYGGGFESRRDATLCALIASCTRRRRRYVQRREPTYQTRSRGAIGHCNDQSSFDILSPGHGVCGNPHVGARATVCIYVCTHARTNSRM